jgi:hypothetical protein
MSVGVELAMQIVRATNVGVALGAALILPTPDTLGRKANHDERDVHLMTVLLEHRALPMWRNAYPRYQCPNDAVDLFDFLADDVTTDPWGGVYELMCSPITNVAAVRSRGCDRIGDTHDDVWSRL